MKIAVLGATGPSGIQVVKEALERGHDVTAVVRNPDKMRANVEAHDRLKVVTANIYDTDSMVGHFQGQDAVLSCLGCPPSYFSLWTITFYTDTAKHIVEALRKAGVKRFVFMSAWYTKYNPDDPGFINWFLKPMFLGQSLKNLGEMEDYMAAECKDIDYTSVRPPQLTNTETTGKPILHEEGLKLPVPPGQRKHCCRRDVARFMLDITEKKQFVGKFMAIASC